jgi:molybdenum cofactor cytidylyltransferase
VFHEKCWRIKICPVSAAGKGPSLGVIILGAGASSRMGRPKLLLPWCGSTVIGHILRQWRELGAAQIAIVHRPNDSALFAELDRLDHPRADRIENPQPELGMFGSVICAANWPGWRREISSRAIALGDQPHLRIETLRELLEFHAAHSAAICQPQFGDHGRHPVILPRSAFWQLRNTPAGTLKDFLTIVACPRVLCLADDSGLAQDLDTPEDYERIKNDSSNPSP